MSNGNGAPFYQDVTVDTGSGLLTLKVQLDNKANVIAGWMRTGWKVVSYGAFYDSMGNEIPPPGNGGGGNMTGPGPSQGPSPGPIINPPGNGGNGSAGPSPQPGTTPTGQGGFDDSTSFAMLFAAFSTLGGIVSGSRKKKKR